jgi:hypothetical protein
MLTPEGSKFKPSMRKYFGRLHLQNNQSKMHWMSGSRGTAFALQSQNPGCKPQLHPSINPPPPLQKSRMLKMEVKYLKIHYIILPIYYRFETVYKKTEALDIIDLSELLEHN